MVLFHSGWSCLWAVCPDEGQPLATATASSLRGILWPQTHLLSSISGLPSTVGCVKSYSRLSNEWCNLWFSLITRLDGLECKVCVLRSSCNRPLPTAFPFSTSERLNNTTAPLPLPKISRLNPTTEVRGRVKITGASIVRLSNLRGMRVLDNAKHEFSPRLLVTVRAAGSLIDETFSISSIRSERVKIESKVSLIRVQPHVFRRGNVKQQRKSETMCPSPSHLCLAFEQDSRKSQQSSNRYTYHHNEPSD